MVLRIGGGDLNAVVGLVGFIAGIAVGVLFLNRGFSLKRTYSLSRGEGYVFPAVNVGLLLLLVAAPSFIFFSTEGPGSMRAPLWAALGAGLVVGAICPAHPSLHGWRHPGYDAFPGLDAAVRLCGYHRGNCGVQHRPLATSIWALPDRQLPIPMACGISLVWLLSVGVLFFWAAVLCVSLSWQVRETQTLSLRFWA